jgi:hypothetical protein
MSTSQNQSNDKSETCGDCEYFASEWKVCLLTGDPENASSGACEEFYPAEDQK